jgi:hypothetical protein
MYFKLDVSVLMFILAASMIKPFLAAMTSEPKLMKIISFE